ncbi:hypothetical protein Ccrd_013676 [Cynara cardunculus var. scolymus]|uniref:Uncharacterized protein n=1 Tax=Cynara cardunculus var. scolymus TaxID=59895 RepID=A0A103YF57_CYNCS|nr:hypothetical protein Ccrd_013676 [Cynara cardunculus var. scolymus]
MPPIEAIIAPLEAELNELTVLKGVGPATAFAVLAAYAPDVAPFMSTLAMVAALGNSKQYTLKQYLVFVEKLEAKAKVDALKDKLEDYEQQMEE